jgi:hypothetical protein
MEAQRLRPGFLGSRRLLCASLALGGRLAEARASLTGIRREQPELSIEWIRASVPYQTPELMERFLDGMRKAGLEDEALKPGYRAENTGQPPFRPNPPA